MGVPHWSDFEKKFIIENVGKMTVEQMSEEIGRSYTAVKLFIHRHRIPVGETVKNNLVTKLLSQRYRNIEDFHPSQKFYQSVGITPQRWWNLYLGKKQRSEEEYLFICDYFNITMQEAFECRQLSLNL